ncbi:MAG: YceI family protein [Saprospiraceae bacterium]|nr:YceI family protein [Saprospiraceae bacterium]
MNHFKLSFLFLLFLSLSSCKEKGTDSASELAAVSEAQGTKFIADASNTKILWEGSKPGGKHSGTININSGDVFVAEGKITGGSINIDMNSITVTDLEGEDKASLEEHLKGTATEGAADFFNVTKYPSAKFDITSVVSTTDQTNANSTVTGNLTLLDITKSINFPATILINDEKVSVSTNLFPINRTEWGIKYGSKSFFDNLADKFIEDNILLQIKLTANKPAAQ